MHLTPDGYPCGGRPERQGERIERRQEPVCSDWLLRATEPDDLDPDDEAFWASATPVELDPAERARLDL